MTEIIRKKLSDSAAARWTAMFIVAFTMMMGYYITDVMSPLEDMLEAPISEGGFGLGWTSQEYGFFSGSYGFINVYLLMLFFGGLILDRMGVRFTGLFSCSLMLIGVCIKYYAVQYVSPVPTTYVNIPFLGLSAVHVKNQVLLAATGFSIFGMGCEICGITVTKVIAKWFTGHSMALAMGIQVAMARLGTAAALGLSPIIAHSCNRIAAPILLGGVCLCIGLLAYMVYCVMDKKLDNSLVGTANDNDTANDEEKFHLRDLKAIFCNAGFWLITLLCLLFYSGVFPFLKFATKLMIAKYGVDPVFAGNFPALVPFGTIILTPLFGIIYDRIGKGATLMMLGSLLLTGIHICFALPILNNSVFAIILMLLLGISFSLVPSALWPSVPKIIPMKQLGSAYAIIFYIQNIGLSMVPILIGNVLQSHTIQTGDSKITEFGPAMWIFATFGCMAVILAIILRLVDNKKHYGLEKANTQQ